MPPLRRARIRLNSRLRKTVAKKVIVLRMALVLVVASMVLSTGHSAHSALPGRPAQGAANPDGPVRGDFNGDGFADLAVGVPYEDVGRIRDAGAVNVLYGSGTGLQADGTGGPDDQFWTQNSPGIAGDGAEANDQFGSVIGAGDFNGDGFADLAIGVPYEDFGLVKDAGAVNVLYGSPTGLQADGTGAPDDQFWNQSSTDVAGDGAEAFDQFGVGLAPADFNGDGFTDLAIGVPNEGLPGAKGAGAANVLYGSSSGLQAIAPDDQFWSQDSPDVKDHAEVADAFGATLIGGDFNGDGFADLVIGVLLEEGSQATNAGAVNVLYGSASGLQADGTGGPDDQFWSQSSPGVEDDSENFDRFGIYLAAGDFNADGLDDVAVGVRYEDIGTVVDAGAVNVMYGSASGLQSNGVGGPNDQFWNQDSAGVSSDTGEDGDAFGRSIAAADFNGDGFVDLAIGVYLEDVGPVLNTGAVNVLYGSSSGLQATGSGGPDDQFWTQGTPGLEGDGAKANAMFGRCVGAGDLNGDGFDDLAVGTLQDIGNATQAGATNAIYGSAAGLQVDGIGAPDDQFWNQSSPGVAGDGAENGDRFGAYLASGD
jgi:hypothetical protein